MKKILKIVIIFMITLSLCGCKNKYKLIDITSEEMANNLFNSDDSSFVLAFYKEDQNNAKEFIKDLEYVIETNKTNIYKIDFNHISSADSILLEMYVNAPIQMNCYMIISNGEVVLLNNYSNNQNIMQDMLKLPDNDTFKKTSDEKKQEYLKLAEDKLKEGKISESYSEYLKASTLPEAKEFYKQNKEKYHLIGTWISTKKNQDKLYEGIYVEEKENIYSKYVAKDQDLTDIDYNKKKTVYFKVIDDIIYTCDVEGVNYKKSFQILEINEKQLKLLNLKTKKTLEYIKKG